MFFIEINSEKKLSIDQLLCLRKTRYYTLNDTSISSLVDVMFNVTTK